MTTLPTGLYLPGTSILHRLCPWNKILCLLLILAATVTVDTLWGYGILALFAALTTVLSGLPADDVLRPVLRLRWFFLVIFLMNLCFYDTADPWFRLWILTPSAGGVMQGAHVALRVMLLLIFSGLLTGTTAPLALTGAMETLLSPLRFLGVPVGQIAMILSVAVQFIPTLLEEADAIRKAQTARGARFDSKRLWDKAGAVAPLAVPIFLAAFQRADELSLAMEARGYRPECPNPRTRASLHGPDIAALLLCAGLCAGMIAFF